MTKNSLPSKEQVRKFWEWCGLQIELVWASESYDFPGYNFYSKKNEFTNYHIPAFKDEFGEWQEVPELDLNNIFKYAVPKLLPKYSLELITWNEGRYKVIINKAVKGWAETFTTRVGNDPALALFWAIMEIING